MQTKKSLGFKRCWSVGSPSTTVGLGRPSDEPAPRFAVPITSTSRLIADGWKRSQEAGNSGPPFLSKPQRLLVFHALFFRNPQLLLTSPLLLSAALLLTLRESDSLFAAAHTVSFEQILLSFGVRFRPPIVSSFI